MLPRFPAGKGTREIGSKRKGKRGKEEFLKGKCNQGTGSNVLKFKNSTAMSEWVDQFNRWLVPSSHSTGNIPRLDASTDSTERLWCKTGSNVLKFKKFNRCKWMNSTTDWFLVVIQLETYLDWTLTPLIPLSDFNVGPAQTSWNSNSENSTTDT